MIVIRGCSAFDHALHGEPDHHSSCTGFRWDNEQWEGKPKDF